MSSKADQTVAGRSGRVVARLTAWALLTAAGLLPATLGGCVTRVLPSAGLANATPSRAGLDAGSGAKASALHAATDPGQTGSIDSGASGAEQAPTPKASDEPIELPWPQRFGPSHPVGPARGVIVPLLGPLDDWRGVHLGEFHTLHAGQLEREDVRLLTEAVGGGPRAVEFQTEGPGSYVFTQPIKPGQAPPAEALASDPVLFKHVAGRPARGQSPGIGDANEPSMSPVRMLLERTWFSFDDPAAGLTPRGVVVIIPGMFGTPEPVVDGLERSLRSDGWAVLRMRAHPSRFTERIAVEVPEGAENAAADLFAEEMGQRAASCAVAVRDALEHVLTRERPALEGLPIVLLGMSGGAIALPTVHALDPDRYAGAVLIAGGVNYLRIDLESNYAAWIDAIDIDWTPEDASDDGQRQTPPRERALRLARAYLDAAPLDGYHTAPLLRDKPVLMIHGSADRAVPAASGDLLWERAGRPERWILPVGHELLFISLPTQAGRIVAWLDGRFPGEPRAAAGRDADAADTSGARGQ